jgi:hypothetical protein
MTQNPGVRTRAGLVLASAGLCLTVMAATAEARLDRKPVAAQAGTAAPQPAPGAPEVSLGKGQVVSGELVFLALVVFQDELKVVRTTSEISFPNKNVSFEGFDRIGEQDPALKIEADVVVESRLQERGVVKVDVASGRDKPLPEGALLKLKFRVTPETRAGVLRLTQTARAVTVDGKTIVANATDAEVKVSETAVYSCFFYMH